MAEEFTVLASRKTGEALQAEWDGMKKRIVALEMALSEMRPRQRDEALRHLGNVLYAIAEMKTEDRCRALDEAVAFHNAAQPDSQIAIGEND